MSGSVGQGASGRGEPVSRLKKRHEFVRAAGGRKAHSALFTVQAVSVADERDGGCRIGFTVTKKVGHATERNRIKRRLRELVRIVPALPLTPAHDYVIVARRDVLTASFDDLRRGFHAALRKLQGGGRPKGRSTQP